MKKKKEKRNRFKRFFNFHLPNPFKVKLFIRSIACGKRVTAAKDWRGFRQYVISEGEERKKKKTSVCVLNSLVHNRSGPRQCTHHSELLLLFFFFSRMKKAHKGNNSVPHLNLGNSSKTFIWQYRICFSLCFLFRISWFRLRSPHTFAVGRRRFCVLLWFLWAERMPTFLHIIWMTDMKENLEKNTKKRQAASQAGRMAIWTRATLLRLHVPFRFYQIVAIQANTSQIRAK